MSWLQTLVIATVPALVTLAGLMLQLRITGGIEERRRQQEAAERDADRQHELLIKEIARSDALEDHWRDERRRAHAHLIQVLDSVIGKITPWAREAAYESAIPTIDNAESYMSGPTHPVSDEEWASVEAAMTDVALLARESTLKAADKAFHEVKAAKEAMLNERHRAFGDKENPTPYDFIYQQAIWATLEYKTAVRSDLGTTGEVPELETRG